MKCQVCSGNRLYTVLDLGHHPPSDDFLSDERLNKEEIFYPLKAVYCEDCKLVQLSNTVDPKALFTDHYVYMSSSNKVFVKHANMLVDRLIKEYNLKENDFVIDVGSNDGTLLENYIPHNVKILGVDPSSVAKVSIEKGIPTINEFFDENLAKDILKNHGKAKIITGLNVFAHVKELASLINGVKMLLEDSGVFITESHYLLDMVEKLQYDEIYHEHLRYYSLEALINLFKRFGMDVFHAERTQNQGGSILVFACKRGVHTIKDSVATILEQEKGLNTKESFENFRKRVNETRIKLRNLLHDLKSKGHRIIGIGAPAKSTTLLNFCKIDSNLLDYLVETNMSKANKYSPGMHIKIFDESEMVKDQPEYAVMLPWNIKDDIIPKIRNKGYKGKIIIPIPEPSVIES
ncbi:MAG: class I SAM-dependent methyltransferase [Candidatus Aenigmarchaeota archaeon]|nr:class I SAM-dependent methyltransferase [Candidatus Aenigmarchaeota archaeon]